MPLEEEGGAGVEGESQAAAPKPQEAPSVVLTVGWGERSLGT